MKRSIISTLLFFGAITAVFGQENTASSADQTLRSNARVNPSTLGMEMQISLGNYPGRGLSVPVTLNYSSKLWRMRDAGTIPTINNPSACHKLGVPMFAEQSASGWTTGMATPYVEYTGRDNIYNEHGFPINMADEICEGTEYQSINYVRRIMVHLPGGETHELRADDTIISYDASSSSDLNVNNQANWNTTYYAADGSNLRYIEDSTTGLYRLLMTDGSFIDFGSSLGTLYSEYTIRKASTLTDRNGNTITYHDTYQTDTLGRNIPLPIGLQAPTSPTTSSSPQVYQIPGLGGGSNVITYNLQWKKLKNTTSGESGLSNYSDTLCYRAGGYPYPGRTQPPTGSCILFTGHGSGWVYATPVEAFNPIVLTEIGLPNGTSYKFGYDVYGRINKVTYPTGGVETFEYSVIPSLNPPVNTSNDINGQVNFGVTHREVVESSGATPLVWTYSTASDTNSPYGFKIRTVAPDSTKTDRYILRGHDVCPGCTSGNYGYDTPLAGMPYEERAYTSASTDTLVSRRITTWALTQLTISGGDPVTTGDWHPRVTKEESIVYDPSNGSYLSATATTDYDGDLTQITTPLNAKTINQYGFSTTIGSLGSLVKTTEIDYLSDSNYTAQNMTGLVSVKRVKDSAGTIVSQSEMVYDDVSNYPLLLSSVTPAGQWSAPPSSYRGNPNTLKVWDSTKGAVTSSGNFISTHAQFDKFGNREAVWDALGNSTTTAFDTTYYAFPVTVTSPVPDSTGTYGSSTAFTTTNTFDVSTGLPLTTTDANGLKTEITYDSTTLRPTDVKKYYGSTQVGGTQETVYIDTPGSVSIESRSQIDSTHWAESYKYFDGLGRVIRTRKVDAGGDDYTLICYDSMSRIAKTTNPFRSYSTQDCSTSTGLDWTSNTYDAAGRPWKVTTPDTAVIETTYGVATSGSQIGTTVTVTDQAAKVRRSITNGLGQLIRVDEPTTSGLGTISSPNQATTYAYDTLNNLTGVTQGSQTRSFSYNSLARLTSASNPESGTISYGYDDNGNLTSKTDARSITTTYTYDHLNRVKQRSYNDGVTPTTTYYYDNLTNANGKLKKVTNANSTTEYTAFDILGRVTGHKQTIGSHDYATAYTYNLGGALLEETYPSGRMVKNTIGTDGSLSQVETKPSGGSYATRAGSFVYTPAGAASSLELGNGKYENTVFNSRLQPTQINLGTSTSDTSLLHLVYTYESSGNHDNNGNVLTQTITVPGLSYTFNQSYNYDELNRLASATETYNGSQNWKQEFSYDRYGNRSFVTGSGHTDTLGSCTTMCNPSFSNTTNRITSSGYSFDNAGNTTADPSGRSFVYDAENKQTSVSNGGGTIGTYYYDGDGKRVKKTTSTSDNTVFVYDATGRLVEEYPTSALTTVATAYVYAGSRLLSTETSSGTSYLTADHLGSPRINTDGSGNVVARHDYMPFGEEISTSQRTTALGYQPDTVRKQFTGYERDNEISLDFAQARYSSFELGRFTSPDPYMIVIEIRLEKDERKSKEKLEAYLVKAQQWNRYSYVVNNPLVYVDPSGETLTLTGSQEDNERVFNLLKEMVGEKGAKNLNYTKNGDGSWTINYEQEWGGLAIGGTFGVALESIIDSTKRASLEISHTDKLLDWGGARTTESKDNSTITITISADVVATTNDIARMGGIKGTDGKLLSNTLSTSIAHELGHAWGMITDQFGERYNQLHFWQSGSDLIQENKNRAVQLENIERQRLGLGLRGRH